jgi:acetyl-CoA C-acetyltransferase
LTENERKPLVIAQEGEMAPDRAAMPRAEETRGIPDVVEAVNHPTTAFDDVMASEDATEGLTFAQKRRPRWRNR